MDIEKYIRTVPDFPKKEVLFRDITPLLLHPQVVKEVVFQIKEQWKFTPFNKIAAIESRGFFIGSILSYELGIGFVPIRKPGKLPYQKIEENYDLEYGKNTLEMHVDAIEEGDKVLVHDDVLATGGTAAAAGRLVERCGGKVVGFSFMIELNFLKNREKLNGSKIETLFHY
ncbi:MAG: adenine phosphoribosyltransferase [Chitinophagaceae bacterium]